MTQDECFELGFVQKTHGTKGEVLLVLDVDDPLSYEDLEQVFVEINHQLIPFFIESLSFHQDKALVRFQDLNSLEKAQALVGKKLFLPMEELPELDDDQFYYHQVIGYTVEDKHLGTLGPIIDFYELPQQDVLAMVYQGREVLIPVTDEIIEGADHEKQVIYTQLPEGLLQVYLSGGSQDDGFDEP
jgi:16S rRNA processing protein RimM